MSVWKVSHIVDYIFIYGKTKEEHDRNLCAMLQHSRKWGVKLHLEEKNICATEVSYFGQCITSDGIRTQPRLRWLRTWNHCKARMSSKPSWEQLTTCSSLPCLADINVPLRQLLKETNDFVWEAQHDKEFQKIKELNTQELKPELTYFDPIEELRPQDASK